MVNQEDLVIQVNQESKGILDILEDQESLAHKGHQEKMEKMETKMTVPSVHHTIHKKEVLRSLEVEEPLDQEDQMHHLEMMPYVFQEAKGSPENQEEMDNLK